MNQKTILVIEDQEDVRENIAELLELSNYKTLQAADGKEGVKTALSEHPDLILCDIMMPEMDGYETLYLLMKNPSTSSIPFIFLTAKAEKDDFRKGMNMGADDYIVKPYKEMDLLGAVERRLDKNAELLSSQSVDELVTAAAKYPKLEDSLAERKTRKFQKKDIIYREGDYASYAYFIVSGKVKIYKINQDGKEFIHDVLNPNSYLGEKALMRDTDRTEFAMAMEETELALIPRQEFQELIFQNREVSGKFIKMLSSNLVDRERELMDMAYNTVRKRTADALLKLHEKYKSETETTSFKIIRADLAAMVGTAAESVIRILSEFKQEGLIEIDSSQITILKPEEITMIKY